MKVKTKTLLVILLTPIVSAIGACEDPPDLAVSEALMHARGGDQMFMGYAMPWSVGDAYNTGIHFDWGSNGFDYKTQPDQTLAGLPLNLSCSALFDAELNQWDWTTEGTLGTDAFTSIGRIKPAQVPGEKFGMTIEYKGETYEVEGTMTWSMSDASHATSEGTFKVKKGGNVVGTVDGRDTWELVYDDHGMKIGQKSTESYVSDSFTWLDSSESTQREGTVEANGIANSRLASPEPSMFIALGAALLALGKRRR